MNLALLRQNSETDTERRRVRPTRRRYKKEVFSVDWREAFTPVLFMLTLALAGLRFYPALVLIAIILINRLIKNRYDFVIMLGIMATSRAFIPDDLLPVKIFDLVLVVALFALFFYRKDLLTKQVTILSLAYTAILAVFMFMSPELLSIQLLTFREYASILCFVVPMFVFANRDFSMKEFLKRVLLYALIICTFYTIDGIILNGWLLIPADAGAPFPSTFDHPLISPFVFYFPRKYPAALYILIVATYGLARYYRFRWWQWLIVVSCLLVVRTITIIAAVVLTYVIFQGNFRQFMKNFFLAFIAIFVLYVVDSATGRHLRVASHVQQVAEVFVAEDDEDLAEFGSTRMAQILPKYEYLVSNDKLWTGLGFLHNEKSTSARYMISNDLYSDISQSEESVGAATEVTQFNTVIHIGLIGFAIQTLYFLSVFFVMKRARVRDAFFYLSTLLCASVMGLGGFAGLIRHDGLIWVAVALGLTLMQHRRGIDEGPELEEETGFETTAVSEADTTR